jgi:hypothetical protein
MSGRGLGGKGLGKGVMFHSSSDRNSLAYVAETETVAPTSTTIVEDKEESVVNEEKPVTIRKRKRIVKNSPSKESKKDNPPRYQPTSRGDWEDWLAANHQIAKEIWVVYFKKHTKRTDTVKYAEMVEPALCMGWIDSTAKNR